MSEVKGQVWIQDFTSPLPVELRSLKTVSEGLIVYDNPGLTSLDGLECVRTASGLGIEKNPVLVDISALDLISAPIISLRVNAQLEVASALASVADVEALSLLGNERLRVLPKLLPSVRLRTLDIEFCPALESLDALSEARGMPNAIPSMRVELRENPSLESISGIAELWPDSSVPEFVTLDHLPALKSLTGLETLREVTYLTISDLESLEDLSGLSGLEVALNVRLENLPSLPSLDGLGALRQVEILRIGEPHWYGDCSESGAGLDGLVDLSGLNSLDTMGTLALTGNDVLSSLSGMPSLVSGPYELFISDTPKLSTDEIDSFVEQHGPLSVCVSPPEAWCPCP